MVLTAAAVKALRDETGASLMDCKHALQETDGDFEAAKQVLRNDEDGPDEPAPVE